MLFFINNYCIKQNSFSFKKKRAGLNQPDQNISSEAGNKG